MVLLRTNMMVMIGWQLLQVGASVESIGGEVDELDPELFSALLPSLSTGLGDDSISHVKVKPFLADTAALLSDSETLDSASVIDTPSALSNKVETPEAAKGITVEKENFSEDRISTRCTAQLDTHQGNLVATYDEGKDAVNSRKDTSFLRSISSREASPSSNGSPDVDDEMLTAHIDDSQKSTLSTYRGAKRRSPIMGRSAAIMMASEVTCLPSMSLLINDNSPLGSDAEEREIAPVGEDFRSTKKYEPLHATENSLKHKIGDEGANMSSGGYPAAVSKRHQVLSAGVDYSDREEHERRAIARSAQFLKLDPTDLTLLHDYYVESGMTEQDATQRINQEVDSGDIEHCIAFVRDMETRRLEADIVFVEEGIRIE